MNDSERKKLAGWIVGVNRSLKELSKRTMMFGTVLVEIQSTIKEGEELVSRLIVTPPALPPVSPAHEPIKPKEETKA